METRGRADGIRLAFRSSFYESSVAHDGQGSVLVSRVIKNRRDLGCNFIDMVALQPGTSIGPHSHGGRDAEMYIIIEGEGEMLMGSERLKVSSGDVLINPPHGTHGLSNLGDRLLRLVVIDLPVEASDEN